MERVSEFTKRMLVATRFKPGPKVAAYLYFPFSSRRSDVDGPIKRTIDAVQAGVRAAYPDDRPAWNDRAVERVTAARVPKDQPLEICITNLPE